MKLLSVVLTAATVLVAIVSAAPAPQFGGSDTSLWTDPEIVCAREWAKWRDCHAKAGCDRDCPADEACYQDLCDTPADTDCPPYACTQLRTFCGRKSARDIASEASDKSSDKTAPLSDNKESDAIPETPHLVDIWADPDFKGRYTWYTVPQMMMAKCVDMPYFRTEWSSLKVYPQVIKFSCTFYDAVDCKEASRRFTIDGTSGYNEPNLKFHPGNWDDRIRSMKCEPVRPPYGGEVASSPSDAHKRQFGGEVASSPSDTEKRQFGGELASPPSSTQKRQFGGGLAAPASNFNVSSTQANRWHLVDLYQEKNFGGSSASSVFWEMLTGRCKEPKISIMSVRLWDMDIEYWCRMYEKPGCIVDGNNYVDFPGGQGYRVADLDNSIPKWGNRIKSWQCWAGQFGEN
ncbi:hypothetical protein BU23DRAFT_597745 [Bimuria novae-zelandiae CBS 107.79]|uniref:Uncharacterized protein n=1 Tax=Bimuria novae-zelandiae CBS 107.79 TaxID=1447943 RepID=A0A6A5VGY5_9PLEO|nr:hypothetical protein BU23DRAFT_597745 [Bimuria novae-zelandiae CBS 107.79]